MFDDFFYHKPVTAAGTNLDGNTRATQVSVGSFQVRNSGDTQIPVVQMENLCKIFFRWDDLDGDFFFPKIVKLRLVWSFFRSFRFWFWMILDEFNLMIEKLKRRKLLGINIASGTILHFAKTPLPGRFARRTPLWIWTLDLEKPWLLWWEPWWWNSSKFISSWNFCCWPASWHFQCN